MAAKAVALSLLVLACLGALSGEHVRRMTVTRGCTRSRCLCPACVCSRHNSATHACSHARFDVREASCRACAAGPDDVDCAAAQAQSIQDCQAAYGALAKNTDNTCYASNDKGSGCKTKAKVGSCEIRMCQNPVGYGTVSKKCKEVAKIAAGIIGGAGFPNQQHRSPSNSNLIISVDKTDPKDTGYADCGSPTIPCNF